MFRASSAIFCDNFRAAFTLCRPISYIQGQRPAPNLREYFYYIDHQGMLFLDDARMKNFTSCFKDKEFLVFFFKRLRKNTTDRYKEFPYISICGREKNYVRCDDLPIVYTHVLPAENKEKEYLLSYAYTGPLLTEIFQPDKIYMCPNSGRVYHPADERFGSIGLVRSKLAIEFSKNLEFRNGEEHCPTHFKWDGTTYELNLSWCKELITQSQYYNLSMKE